MANILLLNGPNLNLLGKREPNIYGSTTLADILQKLTEQSQQFGHNIIHLQSNAEFELVNKIQSCKEENFKFCIINPAAFTHTSIALRDAFLAVDLPFIEVHLSNVYARESFRQKSFLSDIAVGVITGLGTQVYQLALLAANHYLENQSIGEN